MEKQPNKMKKQKKTYKEIAMEKQTNIGKIGKNNQRKKQGKQTMKMTTVGRKPIARWPETDTEDGVESKSQGMREKTSNRRRTAKQARRRFAVHSELEGRV